MGVREKLFCFLAYGYMNLGGEREAYIMMPFTIRPYGGVFSSLFCSGPRRAFPFLFVCSLFSDFRHLLGSFCFANVYYCVSSYNIASNIEPALSPVLYRVLNDVPSSVQNVSQCPARFASSSRSQFLCLHGDGIVWDYSLSLDTSPLSSSSTDS